MNNNRFQPNRNMRFGRGPRHLFREKPKNTKGAIKRLIRYLGGFKTLIISYHSPLCLHLAPWQRGAYAPFRFCAEPLQLSIAAVR